MPSTVIKRFAYDPQARRLEVEFTSGRAYAFHDVPEAAALGLSQAFAKGEYFNAHIRNRYRFTRLGAAAGRSHV
jgi:lysyl-tRNA synthetase class 2